jgi:uncharacterized membrane protein YtjA (UPF0391 family)
MEIFNQPRGATGAPRPIISTAGHGKEPIMLSWTIAFLILAIVAGLLGFGGVAGTAASIAQVLFVVFLVLLVVSALSRALRGKTP